jgi:hypothetical protein
MADETTSTPVFRTRSHKTVNPRLHAMNSQFSGYDMDQLVLEGRQILLWFYDGDAGVCEAIQSGQYDDTPLMDCTLAGIVAGREDVSLNGS